jgi:acyl carrier protein
LKGKYVTDARQKIQQKIIELAKRQGNNASSLGFADSIPDSGILDSPSLLELILWFENEFGLEIDQEQLTVENFGTIDAMASYAASYEERPGV